MVSGARGDDGENGEPGSRGNPGDQGDTGEPGERGIQGIQGVRGPQGDTGSRGPLGPRGSNGQKGNLHELMLFYYANKKQSIDFEVLFIFFVQVLLDQLVLPVIKATQGGEDPGVILEIKDSQASLVETDHSGPED